MTFDIEAAALEEIAATVEHYEHEREGLGFEFLDELEAAKARVATMPRRSRSIRAPRCNESCSSASLTSLPSSVAER